MDTKITAIRLRNEHRSHRAEYGTDLPEVHSDRMLRGENHSPKTDLFGWDSSLGTGWQQAD